MCHRPASVQGLAIDAELGVYGGWVAHEGSFAALQSSPIAGSSSSVLFCGECFDAEAPAGVSVQAQHAAQGDQFVAGLNGLFTGMLIDRPRGQALLFNDRYGSERLYYFDKDGATYFASEAKALLAVLPELRAFDDTGVAQFLAFGSTLDGHTLFRGLKLVPGGSLWRFVPGAGVERARYFEPVEWESLPTLTDAGFAAALSDTFDQVLPAYLRSDQAVGLSLTGGLDTRMIVACMPRSVSPTVAYTYAAEGSDALLDLRIARQVAQARGIEHHALRIGTEFLADFADQVDHTVRISDGCAGLLGAHELSLSRQARQLAPVRLTGNFGSEVLRSVSTFKRNGPGGELLDPAFAGKVETVLQEQVARQVHPVTHAAFEEVPWHLGGTLAVARSQLTFRTPYMDNRLVRLAYQAPAHLRRTATPSLQLIHDHDPALAALPTDRGVSWGDTRMGGRCRRIAAEAMFKLDYWHKEGLPDILAPMDGLLEVLARAGMLGQHKFLAYRKWLQRDLAAYAAQVLADSRTRGLPYWSSAELKRVAQDHATGRRNRLRDLHAVMTLEAVHRLLIDANAYREPAPTVTATAHPKPCPTY